MNTSEVAKLLSVGATSVKVWIRKEALEVTRYDHPRIPFLPTYEVSYYQLHRALVRSNPKKPIPTEEELRGGSLTTGDVARWLHFSITEIINLIDEGYIDAFALPKPEEQKPQYRIPIVWIEKKLGVPYGTFVVDAPEVQKCLGVTKQTLYNYIAADRITAIKLSENNEKGLSGRWRIVWSSVENFQSIKQGKIKN